MSRRTPAPPIQREFRNDKALVVWIFVATWLGFLCCFSYLAVRDGGIAQVGRWAFPLLGLFWLFGVAAALWAGSFARVHIRLGADGVQVSERYPWRLRAAHYPSRAVNAPCVEIGKDIDGDPYFYCVLHLPGPHRVCVAEGAEHAAVEALCAQLHASLRSVCRGYTGRSVPSTVAASPRGNARPRR